MDSTNSNSVSYKTQIPAGYVFKPNEDEIYSYFIPTRIRSRKPVFGVEEIDIYGDKSPDDLFGNRDPRNHIYLFTRLKKEKETHRRFKRNAGDGIWQCQKPTVLVREINGDEIRIGTMRQFTYKGGKQEWIMHEYCIEDEFLNYMINGGTNHPNPENIVLCHVYNKKAKRHYEIGRNNNEEFNQQKKRKTNYSNCDHQPLLPEPPQAQPLVPRGEDDNLFIMQNYGHGDQAGFILQAEPTYYPSTTKQTYNGQGGDE